MILSPALPLQLPDATRYFIWVYSRFSCQSKTQFYKKNKKNKTKKQKKSNLAFCVLFVCLHIYVVVVVGRFACPHCTALSSSRNGDHDPSPSCWLQLPIWKFRLLLSNPLLYIYFYLKKKGEGAVTTLAPLVARPQNAPQQLITWWRQIHCNLRFFKKKKNKKIKSWAPAIYLLHFLDDDKLFNDCRRACFKRISEPNFIIDCNKVARPHATIIILNR